MAITFPTSLDSLPNPTGSDLMENATAALDHDIQHSNANDAIEALEAKVGINGSAVTTSHDYKLSEVTSTDKAVGKTATQTLTNKTLTAPQINMGSDATGDMLYRNGSGVTTRLPIGTTGQILEAQASGIPAWVANPAATDASTTAKGVVEEATLAETLARTTTGGTSARLFVNPSTLTTVQTYDYVADTGSSTAYAIAPTPAITAYVVGQEFTFKATNANTTTTPTLAVSGLTAGTITTSTGGALAVGDIAAGQIIKVIRDTSTFKIVSPLATTATTTSLYFPQTIGINTNGITTAATAFNMFTSETDGSVLYSVTRAGNASSVLERWAKDSSGAYYRTHSVTHNNPGGVSYTSNTARFGLAVVGSNLYLSYSHSSTTTVVFRFNKADLTTETAITISGTAPAGSTDYKQMYTNGSDLIICSNTTTWYRYTISGTTISNAATVTTLTGATVQGCVGDGTNVFFTDDNTGTIYKYSFTGTLSTSIVRPSGFLFASGETVGIVVGNSSVFFYLRGGIVESNSTQVARAVNLIPITRF